MRLRFAAVDKALTSPWLSRIGNLWFVWGLVFAGYGFLITATAQIGVLSLSFLATFALLFAASIAVAVRARLATRRASQVVATAGPTFPMHGLDLKEAWHFHDDDDHGLGNDFMVVGLRFTNKEPSKRVNLNAELFVRLVRFGQELGSNPIGSKLYPRSTRPLQEQLRFPIPVEPETTITGLIVVHIDSLHFDFGDFHTVRPKWESEVTLVLEDFVSSTSLELGVPFAAAPPKDDTDEESRDEESSS